MGIEPHNSDDFVDYVQGNPSYKISRDHARALWERFKGQYPEVRNYFNMVRKENEALTSKCGDLFHDLRGYKRECHDSREEIVKEREGRLAAIEERDTATTDRGTALRTVDAWSRRVAELAKENAQLRAELADTQEELDRELGILASTIAEHSEAKQRLGRVRKERDIAIDERDRAYTSRDMWIGAAENAQREKAVGMKGLQDIIRETRSVLLKWYPVKGAHDGGLVDLAKTIIGQYERLNSGYTEVAGKLARMRTTLQGEQAARAFGDPGTERVRIAALALRVGVLEAQFEALQGEKDRG